MASISLKKLPKITLGRRAKKAVLLVLLISLGVLISFFLNSIVKKKFSNIIGSILQKDLTQKQEEQVIRVVNTLGKPLKVGAWKDLTVLEEELGTKNILDVTLPQTSIKDRTYKGVFCNDIRDARVTLANIDKAKEDGFNTIWLQAEIEPTNPIDRGFYIPGKEAYLFYLNAFRQAGFRIILSVGHTSYSFPYGRGERTKERLYPLENRFQAYEVVEPLILEWAQIAQKHKVDMFIPLEEANKFALDDPQESVELSREERDFVSTWSQNIREKVEEIYSGKLGFATNDGGSESAELVPCSKDTNAYCSAFEWSKGEEGWIGPDFNYRGYNYIFTKVPFLNSMKDEESWIYELNNRMESCTYYTERDNTGGFIWYEAGLPIGPASSAKDQNHITLTESDRESALRTTFQFANKYHIAGIFFKPSPKQVHEGNWNFFGHSSEEIIRKELTSSEVIEPKPKDSLWIKLGLEGLRVIQTNITKEEPFDPVKY